MKRILKSIVKSLAAILLAVCFVVLASEISPVYDFAGPKPFSGPDIFNPYATLDTSIVWKKANFHTHTRVNSILNECDYYPGEVLESYRDLGYDIVTFSNHNELTTHPVDSSLQVNLYEHGYNLFKYHLLVFGCDRVMPFDPFIPILTSQRQWKMDMLGEGADFIQLNHPFRTNMTSRDDLEDMTGYRIIELDSGVTTEQEYWDWALSAGHYSFALANDDLHYPDRSVCIARRCNMLNCNGATYEELKSTLLSGAYYSMRIPDFGDGDWDVKREELARLPYITGIGVEGDSVYVSLSENAAHIKATGQNGKELVSAENAASLWWRMSADDTYVRFTAYFDNGVVIYTNPFARYDSSLGDTPYVYTEHKVNVALTILWNVAVLAMAALCVFAMVCLFRKKRGVRGR